MQHLTLPSPWSRYGTDLASAFPISSGSQSESTKDPLENTKIAIINTQALLPSTVSRNHRSYRLIIRTGAYLRPSMSTIEHRTPILRFLVPIY